jgi:hypothetical protein
MRKLALFIALALSPAAPAVAQSGPAEALRGSFPAEHAALSAKLAGKAPEEARKIAYAEFAAFLAARRQAILGAPAATLRDLELRQGAMLRALGREDVRRCALIADLGFFSAEAAAVPPPPGIDEFAAALVAAARTVSAAPVAPAGRDDFLAWIAAAEKSEPGVPVRLFLTDKAARAASPPASQCRAAAALHEAAASLPGAAGERMSRTMLGIVLAPVAGP